MAKLPKHIIILYLVVIAGAIQFYYLFFAESTRENRFSSHNRTPSMAYTTPSANSQNGTGDEEGSSETKSLSLDDSITGILILEEDPYHPVSEKQARVLLKMMKEVKKEREETSRLLYSIDRVFTEEQLDYIRAARMSTGAGYMRETPEQAISKILKILEKN